MVVACSGKTKQPAGSQIISWEVNSILPGVLFTSYVPIYYYYYIVQLHCIVQSSVNNYIIEPGCISSVVNIVSTFVCHYLSMLLIFLHEILTVRSEERRVGKECLL